MIGPHLVELVGLVQGLLWRVEADWVGVGVKGYLEGAEARVPEGCPGVSEQAGNYSPQQTGTLVLQQAAASYRKRGRVILARTDRQTKRMKRRPDTKHTCSPSSLVGVAWEVVPESLQSPG